MAVHIALLRAANVGGTGKLPMAELREMCTQAGFSGAETYIASGNAVFESDLDAGQVRASLEKRLESYAGKPVGVFVLSPEKMAAVRDANPFPDAPGNRVLVTFLGGAVPAGAIEAARHRTSEEIEAGDGVIYVHYPVGAGPSKLILPASKTGTARNMNTVAKLAEMAARRTG